MGAAAYPTIDFGNGEKQMKAFLGVRSFAVNQQTQAPLAAMTLANYLTSEKAQMTYFKEIGFVPQTKITNKRRNYTRYCCKSYLRNGATNPLCGNAKNPRNRFILACDGCSDQ